MPHDNVIAQLSRHGIQPSAQRVAVGEYVLSTDEHPSADRVFTKVKKTLPVLSRATVYNTLNLFVNRGLLRQLVLAEGRVVFDPNLSPHHHFVDEATGRIFDVPWDKLEVKKVGSLEEDFEISEYQVVMRGRRLPKRVKMA
ncbi:MAG TPA: Fur family transcriptional regulator [Polyangiaceae bacterium]|jgi:Fe2+ or Zn2+ uptake regulation protein